MDTIHDYEIDPDSGYAGLVTTMTEEEELKIVITISEEEEWDQNESELRVTKEKEELDIVIEISKKEAEKKSQFIDFMVEKTNSQSTIKGIEDLIKKLYEEKKDIYEMDKKEDMSQELVTVSKLIYDMEKARTSAYAEVRKLYENMSNNQV